ncbi:hypothetical protein D9Q98_002850 [Chlorella vulgaris]|uniref:Transcription initiation factor IIA subunit 2 n=1 Tax=Chlorella vulgaris TaxID=3077 RepID=A0A9D4TU58_CHLVU|nr:hypothetical protein D9Q98_002850 [Chlorella vulgaris]
MACSALYRQTKLGLSLVDALDQLVEEGKLPPQLALRILDEYDDVVLETMEEKVTAKGSLKGHLDIYRFCDNVWTFILSNATFRLAPTQGSTRRDEQLVVVDRVKIVVVDQKLAPQKE